MIVSQLVKEIANQNGKGLLLVDIKQCLLYLLSKRMAIINKIFGNLVYDKNLPK